MCAPGADGLPMHLIMNLFMAPENFPLIGHPNRVAESTGRGGVDDGH